MFLHPETNVVHSIYIYIYSTSLYMFVNTSIHRHVKCWTWHLPSPPPPRWALQWHWHLLLGSTSYRLKVQNSGGLFCWGIQKEVGKGWSEKKKGWNPNFEEKNNRPTVWPSSDMQNTTVVSKMGHSNWFILPTSKSFSEVYKFFGRVCN